MTSRDPSLAPSLRDSSCFGNYIGELFGKAHDALAMAERGELSDEAAAARIYKILDSAEYLPTKIVPLGNPNTLGIDLNIDKLLRVIKWGQKFAPESMRKEMFNVEVTPMLVGMLSMSGR